MNVPCVAAPAPTPTRTVFGELDGLDPADFDTLALGAGPGGVDMGCRYLGDPVRILGIDISRDANATARAAGFARANIDMLNLDPGMFTALGYTGLIATTPCPPFCAPGLRSGVAEMQLVLDSITCSGADHCLHCCSRAAGCFDEGCEHTHPHGFQQPCEHWRDVLTEVSDPRSALVAVSVRFLLKVSTLRWFVMEQVPALAMCWEEVADELYAAGWEWVDVEELDALDYGAAARRRRTFIYGRRYTHSRYGTAPRPTDQAPPSVADVLGWPRGHRIRTRGNRRATGGNLFSADLPSWCLTGKTRSWVRDADGLPIEVAEAGLMQGFPKDFPWSGSRSSAMQQVGDVVSPLVAIAVLGAALDLDWHPHHEAAIRTLRSQYRTPVPTA